MESKNRSYVETFTMDGGMGLGLFARGCARDGTCTFAGFGCSSPFFIL